jgi:hypothetical protein
LQNNTQIPFNNSQDIFDLVTSGARGILHINKHSNLTRYNQPPVVRSILLSPTPLD